MESLSYPYNYSLVTKYHPKEQGKVVERTLRDETPSFLPAQDGGVSPAPVYLHPWIKRGASPAVTGLSGALPL